MMEAVFLNQLIIPDLTSRQNKLIVEREMVYSPSVLYNAWTKQFDQWFAEPGSLLMKFEVNEVFYFHTKFEGQLHPHYGRFLRLEQDRVIEFTWLTGDPGTKGAETVVTVEFVPRESGAIIRVTHDGFFDQETKKGHEEAWPFVLEHLENKLPGLI
jgi:uncharacterized protein YndB with AHSA1/START domain